MRHKKTAYRPLNLQVGARWGSYPSELVFHKQQPSMSAEPATEPRRSGRTRCPVRTILSCGESLLLLYLLVSPHTESQTRGRSVRGLRTEEAAGKEPVVLLAVSFLSLVAHSLCCAWIHTRKRRVRSDGRKRTKTCSSGRCRHLCSTPRPVASCKLVL